MINGDAASIRVSYGHSKKWRISFVEFEFVSKKRTNPKTFIRVFGQSQYSLAFFLYKNFTFLYCTLGCQCPTKMTRPIMRKLRSVYIQTIWKKNNIVTKWIVLSIILIKCLYRHATHWPQFKTIWIDFVMKKAFIFERQFLLKCKTTHLQKLNFFGGFDFLIDALVDWSKNEYCRSEN